MATVQKDIERIAREAGQILLGYHGGTYERYTKGIQGDFATSADLASQDHIIHALHEAYPLDGIIAEENDCREEPRSDYTWIVDPLDGTRNFAAGNALFGVMIARANAERICNAAIYFPCDDALYTAEYGSGAYYNGERIHRAFPQTLKDVRACIAHTDPLASTTPALDAARSLLPNTGFAPCTLFSSAANTRSILDGEHDAFIIPTNCTWDNCAPALLLSEAGFMVSDWQLQPIHPRFGTQHFIAAPETVFEHIQRTLAAFLPH